MKLLQLSGHEVHAHSEERCRGSRPISGCLQPREQVTCVQKSFPGAFGTSNKLWKCSLSFRHVGKSGLEALGLDTIFGSSLEFEHVILRSQPALHSQLVPS
jgi:hypothetical protein